MLFFFLRKISIAKVNSHVNIFHREFSLTNTDREFSLAIHPLDKYERATKTNKPHNIDYVVYMQFPKK